MLESFIFYILGAGGVLSAAAAVLAKNLVRSVIAFAALLLSVAGLFALLYLPFLALGQLVIFVGGLIVLLLFGVMFAPHFSRTDEIVRKAQSAQGAGFATVFIFFAVILSVSFFQAGSFAHADFKQFSSMLFNEYWEGLLLGVFALFIALITAVFLLEED